MKRGVGVLPVVFVLFVACGGHLDDASPDAGRGTKDAGHREAAPPPPEPALCPPETLPSFEPTWHPPHAHTGDCTPEQIEAYAKCADIWLPELCDVLKTDETMKKCLACLVTDEADAVYGPLIQRLGGAMVETNEAGCIAIAEGVPEVGTECSRTLDAISECEKVACTCATSIQGAVDCYGTAYSLPCSEYAKRADTICDPDKTPAACSTIGFSMGDVFRTMAPLFCGH